MQLEFHSSIKDTTEQKEIWSLTGSQIVAFELDSE